METSTQFRWRLLYTDLPFLVWLVSKARHSLDNAYHWLRHIWVRDDDNFVSPSVSLRELGGPDVTLSLPIQLYLVDTFTFAASALAAASVRSVISHMPASGALIFAPHRSSVPCLGLRSLSSANRCILPSAMAAATRCWQALPSCSASPSLSGSGSTARGYAPGVPWRGSNSSSLSRFMHSSRLSPGKLVLPLHLQGPVMLPDYPTVHHIMLEDSCSFHSVTLITQAFPVLHHIAYILGSRIRHVFTTSQNLRYNQAIDCTFVILKQQAKSAGMARLVRSSGHRKELFVRTNHKSKQGG